MGFIYIITCKTTNKHYIGQTRSTVSKRWSSHKSSTLRYQRDLEKNGAARSKHGSCPKLCNAMIKYGFDDFTIEPLIEVDDELLDDTECKYIAEYDSVATGYNLRNGGDSSTHSDETKALLKSTNSEHMKTTFVHFRKHDELTGLPQHCVFIVVGKQRSFALKDHPLHPGSIRFSELKYGSLDNAKAALIEYIRVLEDTGEVVPRRQKTGNGLPRGVQEKGDHYFVTKMIKGHRHCKYFSGCDKETNLANAIAYLETIKPN